MKKVKIIADATCDLPVELIKKYDIEIIPIKVIFGEEVLQPYLNLTNEEFYQRLMAGEKATTSVPSPKTIKDVFSKGLDRADEIIVITVSSKLSGIFNAANLVKKQFFDERVTIVDSLAATAQNGLIVYEAAKKAHEGKSKQEVLEYLNQTLIPNAQLISYADDLRYLRRSGRISRLKHLMGSLLKIKPIFRMDQGAIVSPGKIMLWQNIDDALKKLMAKVAGQQIVETAFVAHSNNSERCKEYIEYFKNLPNAPKDILMTEVGPIVGTHVGPNTIGFVWIGKCDNKWFDDL